jgi:hypothetical protein
VSVHCAYLVKVRANETVLFVLGIVIASAGQGTARVVIPTVAKVRLYGTM